MNKEMKKSGKFSDIEQLFWTTWKENPIKAGEKIMHRKARLKLCKIYKNALENLPEDSYNQNCKMEEERSVIII